MTWLDRAACAGDLEFTERAEEHQDATCRVCPVRAECRAYGATLWVTADSDDARAGLLESTARFGGVAFHDLAEASC